MSDISRRAVLRGMVTVSASLVTTSSMVADLAAQPATSSASGLAKEFVIGLGGEWAFRRDDECLVLDQRWYSGELQAGLGPKSITLPGTTDEAKAGHANPDPPSLSGLYRENVYVGAAWYQREIVIPPSWKGKSISLFLERVHWVTRAWIDGRPLGSEESLISPHIYDLGAGVTPGKHLLVQVVDKCARNHRLGNVFEAGAGRGRLLVCTLNLAHRNPDKQDAAQRSFHASVLEYVGSEMFSPQEELSNAVLDDLLAEAK